MCVCVCMSIYVHVCVCVCICVGVAMVLVIWYCDRVMRYWWYGTGDVVLVMWYWWCSTGVLVMGYTSECGPMCVTYVCAHVFMCMYAAWKYMWECVLVATKERLWRLTNDKDDCVHVCICRLQLIMLLQLLVAWNAMSLSGLDPTSSSICCVPAVQSMHSTIPLAVKHLPVGKIIKRTNGNAVSYSCPYKDTKSYRLCTTVQNLAKTTFDTYYC